MSLRQNRTVVFSTGGMHYTNGNGSNQKVSNADIELNLGISKSALFSGSTVNPRVWNGTIHYQADRSTAGRTSCPPSSCTGGALARTQFTSSLAWPLWT